MPRPLPRLLAALALSLALPTTSASAQAQAPAQNDAVLAVVKRMFDGMRARDTAMLNSVWAPGARLVSIDTRSTPHTVRYLEPAAFAASVGRATESLDEKTYEPVVQIDGNVAQVWTYYTLHVGTRFSHCGYDAFHLVKLNDEWKITQVQDTRQREGCRFTGGAP